jgi:hypothetical protein
MEFQQSIIVATFVLAIKPVNTEIEVKLAISLDKDVGRGIIDEGLLLFL